MDYRTIEPGRHGGYWLVEHGNYPEHSVRAGMPRRQLVKHYEDLETAIEQNPGAEVLENSTYNPYHAQEMPQVAPGWFDEADAGERWSEDY